MGQQLEDTDLALSIPTPDELGLTFKEDERGDYWAIHQPTGLFPPFEPKDFPYIMELAGFPASSYPVDSAALALLIEQMRRGQPCEQRLGGPIDARVEVHVSHNLMLAGVIVYPPYGRGKDLTPEALDQALKSARIVRGLINDSLVELTSAATAKQLRTTDVPVCKVVAYGESAYDGQDAWLESLVDEISDRRPLMNEEGQINFFDLGEFPYVDANQALVRRHPPKEGKSGWTVTGKVVKGKHGKDIVFALKDDSVKTAPGDDNLLLSNVAGMPVIHPKGAQVEQVLKLDEVGLKSGHIRFDGSLFVKGNVNPGMKVEVTGDVKIGGLVEAAYIQAGGTIEVVGGVIGRKNKQAASKGQSTVLMTPHDTTQEEAANNTTTAYLQAGANIKARFIQEAKVKAAQEIFVQKQVLHSHLQAGIKIYLPGKAAIVGGITEADQLIDIGISGALANLPTQLMVGSTTGLKQEATRIQQKLKQLDMQKDKLKELIARLKQARKPISGEKKQQIIHARNQLQTQEQNLQQRLLEIEAEILQRQNARIIVRKTCYPGSQMQIDEAQFAPRNDLGKITFFWREGQIHLR